MQEAAASPDTLIFTMVGNATGMSSDDEDPGFKEHLLDRPDSMAGISEDEDPRLEVVAAGIAKYGNFYRYLFRAEDLFDNDCLGRRESYECHGFDIDAGLEIVKSCNSLLLYFADLNDDELGCAGQHLLYFSSACAGELALTGLDIERLKQLEGNLSSMKILPKSRRLQVQQTTQQITELLAKSVLEPIDALIEAAVSILFVACGRLASAPHGAILWRGKPLMLQRPTCYTSSVADLCKMTDKHAAPSLLHCGDVVVVSAPNTSVEDGALGTVPLAALEAAVLQNVLSHGSESNVTCITDATCEAIALDREQREAKYYDDVRHKRVARGMSQPVAIFHFAGHVAGSMGNKEVCLADGGIDLGGLLDDIRAFTTLIYLSACCGDDHHTGHSQHSITGCPGCGPNDNASIVCCSWPLKDVAGLGMSRDFYQHVQKLSLGQDHDDLVGEAVALQAAVAEMSQRTRRDMHGLADAIQQDFSADVDGRAVTDEVAVRGFLALRGSSRSLLAEESDSSDVSDADVALEQLRGGEAVCVQALGLQASLCDEGFYLTCLDPCFWAGYRCYSQPPVRRGESDWVHLCSMELWEDED